MLAQQGKPDPIRLDDGLAQRIPLPSMRRCSRYFNPPPLDLISVHPTTAGERDAPAWLEVDDPCGHALLDTQGM